LDGKTGSLKSVVLDRFKLAVSQNFYYYKGYIGDNKEFANRSSGAYIFRPNGSQALLVNSTPKSITYKGNSLFTVEWDKITMVSNLKKNRFIPFKNIHDIQFNISQTSKIHHTIYIT
jgi:hypothetical protein